MPILVTIAPNGMGNIPPELEFRVRRLVEPYRNVQVLQATTDPDALTKLLTTEITAQLGHPLTEEEQKDLAKTAPELAKSSPDPRVRRLLGAEGGFGRMLGLKDDFAYQAIVQVGAYDEIFERNVGAGSALKLARGHNALWNAAQPGLLYAPPIR